MDELFKGRHFDRVITVPSVCAGIHACYNLKKLRLDPMLGLKHFRHGRNDDRRHRTHASDPEGSVQPR